MFDVYCFYLFTFRSLTHRDDFNQKQLMHALLKETEGNWRAINGNVTGQRLGELRNIMKSVSQDDLFVA